METGIQPLGAATGQWCDWHKGPSGTARPVQRVERQSGAPVTLYACTPCREQRRLTPLAGAAVR